MSTYKAVVSGHDVVSSGVTRDSLPDAFAWVKARVRSHAWERGTVWIGNTLLLEFTSRTTIWHADGYERWSREREAPPPGVEMTVDSETFDAIAQMIESPPEPTPELKRLMGASAPWDDAEGAES